MPEANPECVGNTETELLFQSTQGAYSASFASFAGAGIATDPDPRTFSASSAERKGPARPDEAAFHGLAGDFVRSIEPHTEADPTGLLIQFLALFGNAAGRNRYAKVEADHHYPNIYVCLVGDTSKGRKGTSLGRVKEVFRLADPEYSERNVTSGLSTGEGLIHALRDPFGEEGEEGFDPGVSDKRLMLSQSEFALVLKHFERQGNTLSATLRQGWDGEVLRTLTKSSATRATNPHVSLIGHITTPELRRYLSSTEVGNGFGNRILWAHVRRAQLLPEGGIVDTSVLESFASNLRTRIASASSPAEIGRSPEFRARWRVIYEELGRDRFGLVGALTSRAEAQVLRIALIHALLDESDRLELAHLEAAYALWRYCDASVTYVFGDATGDAIADRISELLEAHPQGLSRTELSNQLGRHTPKHQLDQALQLLTQLGRANSVTFKTQGRPSTIWFAGAVSRAE
jgi:hypothetical protein